MTSRENRFREVLGEVFPDVEPLGMNRFMVWGPSQRWDRVYVELWFDDDFLEQEDSDFGVSMARIACEAKEMLNDPDRGIQKRGEILVSGNSRIEVHREGDTFSITGVDENCRQPTRPRGVMKMPGIKIDRAILDKTTQCKTFSCLSGKGNEPRCEPEIPLVNLLFVLSEPSLRCPYRMYFDGRYSCECPVRKELYVRYGV